MKRLGSYNEASNSKKPFLGPIGGAEPATSTSTSTMNPELYDFCAPMPRGPNSVSNTDQSQISLSRASNSEADELHTHSQTQPYLRNEPTAKVAPGEINSFFRHIFLQGITANEASLDLTDLKHIPSQPRPGHAEVLLEDKLNSCIDPLSPNKFFAWPVHQAPPGINRDRHIDIAIVPRKIPFSAKFPSDTPPSDSNLPDVHAILASIEHTVSPGRRGLIHNRDHAYAKLNELLKCPLNLCFIVLGIHGKDMVVWYGDRSGIIEAELATNAFYIPAVLVGLAKLPFKRDPCVDIYQILPSRAYKITLHEKIYFGLYGKEDSALYTADGINSRGTLVLAGFRHLVGTDLVGTDLVAAFNATTDKDRFAIKFSYPSIPWDVNLSLDGSCSWTLEWQALEILAKYAIPHTPRLVAHDEHSITTKQAREAAGLSSDMYRIRTILVTQPLAYRTLRTVIKKGLEIELHLLVKVLKDVVDAHMAAWTKAGLAHCDISPGNIQIHEQHGILADWDFAISTDQLDTPRAVNLGTLITMPPRLAYYMLRKQNTCSIHETISRTPWDEMCSIFLCFLYVILDEQRDPGRPPLDLRAALALRMTQLTDTVTGEFERLCEECLRDQYRANSALVSRIQQAIVVLFPNRVWLGPPLDADSQEWWRKMHGILDSFVAPV